jgi:hypothetical protein
MSVEASWSSSLSSSVVTQLRVIEEFMLMMVGLVGEEKGKWSLVVWCVWKVKYQYMVYW